jgi:signal transduction histidine kinase
MIKIIDTSRKVHFQYSKGSQNLNVNKAALLQVLINLVTNSIKYNRKAEVVIDIDLKETPDFYVFSVKDNSDGIAEKSFDSIFHLFATAASADRDGNAGTGIGLATVKKIVETLGGTIQVTSTEGEGSIFTFTIAKDHT